MILKKKSAAKAGASTKTMAGKEAKKRTVRVRVTASEKTKKPSAKTRAQTPRAARPAPKALSTRTPKRQAHEEEKKHPRGKPTPSSHPRADDATDAALREMRPASTAANSVVEVQAQKYGSETPARPESFQASAPPAPRELDRFYGDTKLVLLVRDPEWIFAYWEIGPDTRELFGIPRDRHNKTMLMRWYDVTSLPQFTGSNAHRVMDIQVNDIAVSWYQKMPAANRSWCADLGIVDERGVFIPICRSRVVHTPRNNVAVPGKGEEWALADELRLRQIFEASGGAEIPSTLGSETMRASERLVR